MRHLFLVKFHCSLEASDLLFIHRVDVCTDGICALTMRRISICQNPRGEERRRIYRRNVARQIHVLRERHGPLLQRARHIHVLDLITEVRFLIYQLDETIFHLQLDLGALLDIFGERSFGVDRERFSTL